MKIRLGFVSNSSSSSFKISRDQMSLKQYDILRNHVEYAKLKNWSNDGYSGYGPGDGWCVELNEKYVECSTMMNNFDLHGFVLDVLDIPEEAIFDFYES